MFIRSILKLNPGAEDLEKWEKLLTYFNSYWTSLMDFVATCKIHEEYEKYLEIENSTNNALEHNNCLMKTNFLRLILIF